MSEASLAQKPLGFLAIDAHGVVVEAGGAELASLGQEAARLVGRTIDHVFPRATLLFFQTYVLPAVRQNGSAREIYLTLEDAAGHAVPMLANAALRGDGEQPIVDLVFLPMARRQVFERDVLRARREASDATERADEVTRELSHAQRQLVLQERLAALGTMAAGIAHEINTPLAYAMANLEMLTYELETAEPAFVERVGSMVADAREGLGRISEIVRTMRMLSQTDTNEATPTEVAPAVQSAMRLTASQVQRTATLTLAIAPDLPTVMSNPGALCQVLVNLITNAAQALPEHSRSRNRIEVRAFEDHEGSVRIEVSDNGPGIARDLQARIFEPFYTTKASNGGTGLGLPICHRIVHAFGGSLELSSSLGAGATFVVRLPTARAASGHRVSVPPVERAAT
jgi:signal transduction histidine kinase